MSLCPKNITSFVYNSHRRRVTWLEPTVTDNSDGSNVKVTVTRKNGEYFSVGTHLVRYEIADKFGNKDSCEFYVTVKRTSKSKLIVTLLQCLLWIWCIGDFLRDH